MGLAPIPFALCVMEKGRWLMLVPSVNIVKVLVKMASVSGAMAKDIEYAVNFVMALDLVSQQIKLVRSV